MPKRKPPARQCYDTDLTYAQWDVIAPMIPDARAGGWARKATSRELVNAVPYFLMAGSAWRLLPHDLPPWQTVYYYLRRWQEEGVWQHVHHALAIGDDSRQPVGPHRRSKRGGKGYDAGKKITGRSFPPWRTVYRWFGELRDSRRIEDLNHHLVQMDRVRVGREPMPSAAVIDRQSVKTTEAGGPRGYDAGKKVKGRKRHALVDTDGRMLELMVHADLSMLVHWIRRQARLAETAAGETRGRQILLAGGVDTTIDDPFVASQPRSDSQIGEAIQHFSGQALKTRQGGAP